LGDTYKMAHKFLHRYVVVYEYDTRGYKEGNLIINQGEMNAIKDLNSG